MAEQCLFCRIVRGEIPAKMVLETEECIAFRDINPQAPVHVVVIPEGTRRVAGRRQGRRDWLAGSVWSPPRSRGAKGSRNRAIAR